MLIEFDTEKLEERERIIFDYFIKKTIRKKIKLRTKNNKSNIKHSKHKSNSNNKPRNTKTKQTNKKTRRNQKRSTGVKNMVKPNFEKQRERAWIKYLKCEISWQELQQELDIIEQKRQLYYK